MNVAMADTSTDSSPRRPKPRAFRVTPELVRSMASSTNAPPPGPAVHPIVTLRAVGIAAVLIALDLTGWTDHLAVAWAAIKRCIGG